MRPLTLAACAAALALLPAACTTYRSDNEPPPVDAPVISYNYVDTEDRALAAEFADNYCEQAYGQDAVEIDKDRDRNGYQVTYACR
jgi:hypothetical protein